MTDADCTPGREPRSVAASSIQHFSRKQNNLVLMLTKVTDNFLTRTSRKNTIARVPHSSYTAASFLIFVFFHISYCWPAFCHALINEYWLIDWHNLTFPRAPPPVQTVISHAVCEPYTVCGHFTANRNSPDYQLQHFVIDSRFNRSLLFC